MRRPNHLFETIVSRDNLRLAYAKALRGKRHRCDAREFGARLEANLAEMAAQVSAGTFPLGRFRQFLIFDPKERIITAPCFPERVLHHAVMNVCEPVFERGLIDDTFACRVGRGRLAALRRAQEYSVRFPYFLKLDIRKYFDSISHARLIEWLERRFKDQRLLELLRQIIWAFRGRLGRGLPIGSLTSQHFANFYLGDFDRFVKETLRMRGYVRYMDDVAIWADSTAKLQQLLGSCRTFLAQELDLELKPVPYINGLDHGMDFLGCRVFRRHMRLNRRSRVRFRRKLARLEQRYVAGLIDEAELQRRAEAVVAFARTAGVSSWRFRRRVLEELPVSGHRPRTR